MNITVLSVIEKFSYKEDLQEFGNFVQYLQKCLIWWSCFNWNIIHIFRQLSPYDLTRLLFPLQLRSIKFHFLPVFQSTFHFTIHRMTCKKFNLIAQMVMIHVYWLALSQASIQSLYTSTGSERSSELLRKITLHDL